MLNPTDIESLKIAADWSQSTALLNLLQDSVTEADRLLSVQQLLTAHDNTTALVTQAPINPKSVQKLAESIFVTDCMLFSDLRVALYADDYYLIGGRHRLQAIDNVMQQIGAAEQYLRVCVQNTSSTENLIQMILADNDARRVTKQERASVYVQMLGCSTASTPETIVQTVIDVGYDAQQTVDLIARNYFKAKGVKQEQLAKAITAYVLFGIVPPHRLRADLDYVIDDVEAFYQPANRLWGAGIEALKQSPLKKVSELFLSLIK